MMVEYELLFLWIPSPDLAISYVLIFLLLGCSAMISGSEVAFFSLNTNDLKQLKQSTLQNDKDILYLLGHSRHLLATILISNNFINIAIIILSSYALGKTLDAFTLASWLVFFINVVVVTVILVLFGEIAPKVYANVYNLSLARRMSGVLYFLMKVFYYPSHLLVKSTQLIEKKLAAQAERNEAINKQEIEQAIELTLEQGETANEQEAQILKNIIHFGDASVKQIMRSRTEVKALNYNLNFHEILKEIRGCSFSRIPVFKQSLDHIEGILYVKDLLPYLEEDVNFEWQKYLQKPHFVYGNVMIDDLLFHFQKEKVHFAIVVEKEYGGTLGIVTLEDILEEVVGEITDEFDGSVEIDFLKIGEDTFLFDGKTLLKDVCRLANIDMDIFDDVRGDAESIGGLMLVLAEGLPKHHQMLKCKQFLFKIIEVNDRQVKQLQMRVLE